MSEVAQVAGRVLGLLFQFNRNTWARISSDPSIPQTVKTSIYMHLQYPWSPRFLSVTVAPIKPGLKPFLGPAVFQVGSEVYYYPSDGFWKSHADVFHAPKGAGCDLGAHMRFLTPQGPEAMFSYAIVSKDGSIHVANASDFEEECQFLSHGRSI
jgi:hypothetical protein